MRHPGAADYLSRLMAPGMPGTEALQRQLLMERERGLMSAASPLGSHLMPPITMASAINMQQRQHEEYFR